MDGEIFPSGHLVGMVGVFVAGAASFPLEEIPSVGPVIIKGVAPTLMVE